MSIFNYSEDNNNNILNLVNNKIFKNDLINLEKSNIIFINYEYITSSVTQEEKLNNYYNNNILNSEFFNNIHKDELTLKTYNDFIENKYKFFSNINFNFNNNSISSEVLYLKDHHPNKKYVILDANSEYFKYDCKAATGYVLLKNNYLFENIKNIAKQCLSISYFCIGIKLSLNIANLSDEDILLNEIRNMFILDYANNILPSFILFSINKYTIHDLSISLKLVSEFRIPIIIKINSISLINIFNTFLKDVKLIYDKNVKSYLKNNFAKGEEDIFKLIVISFSSDLIGNNINNNNYYCIDELIENDILKKNIKIIFGINDRDTELSYNLIKDNSINSFINYINQSNSFDNQIRINKLIKIAYYIKKYNKQVILTQNLSFLVEYKQGGGRGYIDYVKSIDIIKNSIDNKLSDELFNNTLFINSLNLFSWFKEPSKAVKKVEMIICSFCKEEKPDDDNRFRKNNYVYCNVKCLINHNKQIS